MDKPTLIWMKTQFQPAWHILNWNDLVASWNVWHASVPEEHERSLRLWNNTLTHNKPRLFYSPMEHYTLYMSVNFAYYASAHMNQRCFGFQAFNVKALWTKMCFCF